MTNRISFPQLFDKVFTIDPVAFSIGGLTVKWYGIIICAGFIIAGAYAMKRASKFNTKADDITDMLLWLLPFSIIGARMYYVFSKWDYYSANPSDIIKIWEGGIAIYGGIIAGVIVVAVFCKLKHVDFLSLGDLLVLALLIGQFIGRWGNFMNAEAFGGPTSLPWGMSINGDAACHPTFLYESLWNFFGFIGLHIYSKHRHFKGELILMYFSWYGIGRSWIEGLRTDSLYIGHTDIRVSQLLAIVSALICISAFIYLHIKKRYEKYSMLCLDK